MTTLARALDGLRAETAFVLGSGLGRLVDAIEGARRVPYGELDGFPHSGVSGHAGEVVAGRLAGVPVLMLSGREHYYENGDAAAMRPALTALHDAGVTTLVLTNSAGSTDPDIGPGEVMQIKDHINLSGTNPLIGETEERRFVGMTEAYDKGLRKAFRRSARAANIELHRGVYMWFSGPSFETPAEIRMARRLGADAVGMSTVPEVIVARYLGMRVAAFSAITNFAAGMTGNELSHAETKDMAPKGGERLATLFEHTLAEGLLGDAS